MNPFRRQWLQQAGALGITSALAPWAALAAISSRTPPFGPLGRPDSNGVCVPSGFTARLLATSAAPVTGTDYRWHAAPDGGATFAQNDGWIYVSNSEAPDANGGVGALRFGRDGSVVAAYSILQGTSRNCAGGPTPWGTWLSCEETDTGLVYECDPTRAGQGQVRPLLGRFLHEAAAVDPATGDVYLTEDHLESRFYRFRPARYGRLDAGVLEAARVDAAGNVTWREVPVDAPYRGEDSTVFARGEGAWYHAGVVYLTTTDDHRVWGYEPGASRLRVLYDGGAAESPDLLRDPDNITVHAPSGALLVAEDVGNLEVVLLVARADRWEASPLVRFVGHDDSEVTGPAFSPDGARLYLSSQRGRDGEHGMTFEITGPFLEL